MAANAAMIVLPEPTSPWMSRNIGVVRSRPSSTSRVTRRCAPVSSNPRRFSSTRPSCCARGSAIVCSVARSRWRRFNTMMLLMSSSSATRARASANASGCRPDRRTVQKAQRFTQIELWMLGQPLARDPGAASRSANRAPGPRGPRSAFGPDPRSSDRSVSTSARAARASHRMPCTPDAPSRKPLGPGRASPKQRKNIPGRTVARCRSLKWKKRSVTKPVSSCSVTSQLRRRPKATRVSRTSPMINASVLARSAMRGTTRVRSS